MRSILLTALGNLRRRKKQNLLVGLSIFLSVLLLTTAIGILGGIHKPFDVMFDRLQASHLLLYYDIRENDPREITDWFMEQKEVASVGDPQHYFMVTEPLTCKSEKIDIMVRITEFSAHQQEQDRLLKTNGNKATEPGWGETWIPRHFSVRYGISVGDTIQIPLANGLYPLVVSSIVIDPHFTSGLINPNRLWIAPGMLTFMVQAGSLNQVMQGVRLRQKEDIDKIWARFNREMTYSGSSLHYNLFKSVFTSIYKIIGLVTIVFSILAMVISGFIISSIVISSVLADSQLIGILKALGFKPSQIKGIYLMQYGALLLLFIPPGLLCSYFTIKAILQSLLKSLGLINFDFPFLMVFLCCALFFVMLIMTMVRISAAKAGKILPAQALRSATGDTNMGRKKSIPLDISRFRLSLWIALKMISDNPKKSVYSLIGLVFTVFILGFSVNTSNSFNRILEHKSMWGFDNSDLQVYRSGEVILPMEHEPFVQQLKREEMILEVVPFSYYELTIPPREDDPPVRLNGKAFDEDPGKIGLMNLDGENPRGPNEIALCVGTARKLKKSVGDSVTVLMENEPERLLISGIYQDISNLGEGFRLSTSAVKAVNPIFEPDRYAIVLKDKNQTDLLKKRMLARYGEAIRIELTIEEQLGFMGITRSINASMILISLFFVCILVVSVFNDIYLNIWEKRKSIGIYKLIGFTPKQLQSVMFWKTWILSIAAAALGIPLVLFLAPPLMSSITSGFGVPDFPFIYSPLGSLGAAVLFVLAGTLSTWWASGNMKQMNPQILINE